MKNEPTFLELVIDLVLDIEFSKLNDKDKLILFLRLEENYQKRIDISYRQGFSAGKFEGTNEGINEVIKLLNTK